jgi:DNA-binding response OmpR family regulator
VHGIVEKNKGYIEVESEPGQGCVFRVYLPLVQPVAKPPLRERREGAGGETVLLVEDNPEVRAIIGEILRGERYHVLEAADSEEGMHWFNRHSGEIRLLLVDVVMPGRGGVELYREIRTHNSGVRVLFMSGYPEEQIRSRGVLANDVAFISKPLSPAELLSRVRGVLDA